jgi:hypothetical protein
MVLPIRPAVVSCPAKDSENRMEEISSRVRPVRILAVDGQQVAGQVVAWPQPSAVRDPHHSLSCG